MNDLGDLGTDAVELDGGVPQVVTNAVTDAPIGGQPSGVGAPIQRQLNHARALRLQSKLKLLTSIDDTGRLGNRVEIVYERLREPRGGILPIAVRVGSDASEEEVLSRGPFLPKFRRYNRVLARLHELADRLATLTVWTRLKPDARSAGAYRVLRQLDASVSRRQAFHMPRSAVLPEVLVKEIEFFEDCEQLMTRFIASETSFVEGSNRFWAEVKLALEVSVKLRNRTAPPPRAERCVDTAPISPAEPPTDTAPPSKPQLPLDTASAPAPEVPLATASPPAPEVPLATASPPAPEVPIATASPPAPEPQLATARSSQAGRPTAPNPLQPSEKRQAVHPGGGWMAGIMERIK